MESTGSHQTRVGMFLLIGLVAAMVSIIALGGDKSLFTTYYRLNAKLNQVQGLNKGSIVSLSGMTVGNIEDIGFNSENQLVAIMKIDKKYQKRIAKDSTVEIRTQGALGDKFIYINPGDISVGIADNGDGLSAATSNDLMGIISEKGAEAGKIFDVISEVHKFMKAINADNRSEQMFKNFTEASLNLKEMSAEAKLLIAELRKENSESISGSMKKLEKIMTKIDRGEGTLGALINDPSLHEQLKSFLGNNTKKKYLNSVLQNSLEN